ncbi:MAG: flagellar hook-basal body complex protein [Devosia sp.]|uniref:flagellar hook protein FlgE n=1 Tax=Devosia sp. TaxID=1871048 RepID=UPI0026170106|nr:flagellar hook-basal body complex protein [Devosia sp.]MDB5588653.1 flagellar hook-basal body complex protein [Devosia sp.]
MGIYGALSTAVSGLRAQSHALENISGNIANSQTVGYKRIETSFSDMIADAPVKQQVAGAVSAQSRGTNGEKGDIKSVTNETFIALNSNGFFVVEPKSGMSDGSPTFSGADFYTRRGDFEIDKDGLLVNGAGYYLKGLPVDIKTGNVSGAVPGVIKLSNAFLPAQQTTRINYQANLPQLPKNASYDATVRGSELLNTVDYAAPATTTGMGGLSGAATMDSIVNAGDIVTFKASTGTAVNFEFFDGAAGAYAGANVGVDIRTVPPVSIDAALADMQTKFRTLGGAGAESATVGLSGGQISVSLGSNKTATLSATAAGGVLGLPATGSPDSIPAPVLARLSTIPASSNSQFLADSVAGGSLTTYAKNGAPAVVVMQWAKVDSAASGVGHADTWNLYYMSDSTATGTAPMWTRVDQEYVFGPDGSMNPPVTSTTITGLTVNGVSVGNVELQHGAGGMSQQADVNGKVSTSTLNQNGYGAGEFVSVGISDNGRVVATYSNGERIDMAQVVTAQFNAVNQLKRMDGGVFTATKESGEPMLDTNGTGILGGSLEASNSDISDEFTKLIITQQAYAAGTKIVSTANDMLQQALSMIR